MLAGALALLADAGHMLTDAAALALALVAASFARRPPGGSWTFGFRRVEILATLANGITLALVGIWIVFEAVRRLISPTDVRGGLVIALAVAGILVNLGAAALLVGPSRKSLNVRGAFLHVTTDLAAFAGTAVAGALILVTGWNRFDPLASLAVAGLIFWSSAILLRESSRILLEISPGEMPPDELAREGARVAGGARRVDQLETEIKLELDVTDQESCGRFVEAAIGELGGLDILVNNAGLGLGRDPFGESTEEDEEMQLETNIHGLIRMTRLCLPHIRDGGHIINMGSIAGRQAYENAAVYVASKFAVRGFTYALREDLLGRPVRLTTVDPGLVETNFSRVRFRGDEEKAKAPYEGVDPLRPEDIAECILFALTRPLHVNIDELVVKALAQSSPVRIART